MQDTVKKKVCLITGANRGIGKALTLKLAEAGMTILMVCRNQVEGERVRNEIISASHNPNVHLMIADLSSQASIRQLADEIKATYSHLNVLIHNAGLAKHDYTLTTDKIETTFAVNHLAPFLLTGLLLDLLKAGTPSRVILTSSLVHKWGQIDVENLQGTPDYDMDKAYNQSKLGNVLFAYELARRLSDVGITVNSYEPGMTVSDFGREYTGFKAFMAKAWRPFMATPEKAAETAIYLALSPQVAQVTGKHFVNKKAVRSSPLSYDTSLALRLWNASERLTDSQTLYASPL